MNKRAEERALELFPVDMQMCIDSTGETYETDVNAQRRKYVAFGYEQAEKDTIERAVEWLKVHAKDYIVNMTGSYPDAPFDAIIGGKCWDELKKAMEEE